MAKTKSGRTTRARIPAAILAAVEAMRQKKADDVVALDLRTADAFTDFFLVATGQNRRQVQAIADAVEAALKTRKLRPLHVEGYDRGDWVLLDYFDFVVHVFSPSARAFYGLERLWGTAVPVVLPEPAAPAPATAG
ncbi:MAG: ribosome silencing factor [Vicinamibacterales bacterium]|jgi:ribosome-associated protein